MKARRKQAISIQNSPRPINLVVLGQDGVGKTALTVRLITRRFIGEYDQTIESTNRHHLDVDGTFVALNVMDTAGKMSDEKLDHCMSFGDIFLVLYSIIDKKSFAEAGKIARYIKNNKTLDSTSLIIAGTKLDLGHRRQVKESDGNSLTQDTNSTFYEISIAESISDTQNMVHDVLKQYIGSHPLDSRPSFPAPFSLPPSPQPNPKESKTSSQSSWGVRRRIGTPFRRKSVQTAVS